MKAFSLFDLAVNEEIKDIVAAQTEEVQESKNNYGDDDGNLYFPLASDELLTRRNTIFPTGRNGRETTVSLRNSLDDVVSTIKYDVKKGFDIMSFLANVWKAPEIYGILIKSEASSQYLINPLHPLTALAIKLNQVKIPNKGTIIVYKYEKTIIERYGEYFDANTEKGYDKNIEKTWVSYISQSKYFINSQKITSTLDVSIEKYFDQVSQLNTLSQLKSFLNLRFRDKSCAEAIPKLLMVPLQVIVSSIATPYYGITVLKNPTNSDSYGYNTGGFVSGNIEHRTTPHTDQILKNLNRGNICTGSRPKEKPSGWLTLNRVYLDSMWFSDIIPADITTWGPIATTSKKIACSFFNQPELTTTPTEEN